LLLLDQYSRYGKSVLAVIKYKGQEPTKSGRSRNTGGASEEKSGRKKKKAAKKRKEQRNIGAEDGNGKKVRKRKESPNIGAEDGGGKKKTRKSKEKIVPAVETETHSSEIEEDDSDSEAASKHNDDEDNDDDAVMNNRDGTLGSCNESSSPSCSDSEHSLRMSHKAKRRKYSERDKRMESGHTNIQRLTDPAGIHDEGHSTQTQPREEAGMGRCDARAMPSWDTPMEMKNVRQRVVLFVKNNMFRRIKFLTSAGAFAMAFQGVLEEENPRDPYIFQLTYKKCFEKALNQKQSTCEQAARKIAVTAIVQFKRKGEEFFTFEEFCALRRATTDRERRAFYWFFDTFLECVCGASAWNYAKTRQRVSEAKDACGVSVVSKSDEAFALLLIDNYMEKWKGKAEAEAQAAGTDTDHGTDNNNGMTEAGNGATKTKTTRMAGRYTAKANGQCRYGGWSDKGIEQFNKLRAAVKADRNADRESVVEPYRMEKELLDYCKSKAGLRDFLQNEQAGGAARKNNAALAAGAVEHVEADWDSDDD
jgi:hypothetical protein